MKRLLMYCSWVLILIKFTAIFFSQTSADTASSIPPPVPAMINSTAISVTLPSTPYLPPKDGWTYAQASEVLYHRSGIVEAPQKLTVSGALPQTINATGLKKYTDYLFYAHYFGNMNRKDQNIITRYSAVVKTDEDGMISFSNLL